jgi:hypothetical protein
MGSVAPLKHAGALRVRALDEGTLVLTGDEQATLAPKPGGYWQSADGAVAAVASGGKLWLTGAAYAPLPIYKRPLLYGVLALIAALATAALIWRQRQTNIVPPPTKNPALAGAGVTILLLFLSVVVWLFSPTI